MAQNSACLHGCLSVCQSVVEVALSFVPQDTELSSAEVQALPGPLSQMLSQMAHGHHLLQVSAPTLPIPAILCWPHDHLLALPRALPSIQYTQPHPSLPTLFLPLLLISWPLRTGLSSPLHFCVGCRHSLGDGQAPSTCLLLAHVPSLLCTW
jgi:hypothetical protein